MSLYHSKQVFISGKDGVRLSCRLMGSPLHRPAILTSGIGCGPVFMNKLAQELAQDHFVVYWDYRGHGESSNAPSQSGYRIEDHAGDLARVVGSFCTTQAPVMVGFSMGVQVSIEWTRTHPQVAAAHVYLLGVPRNPMHRTLVLRKRAARLAKGISTTAGPLLNFIQPATRAAMRTPLTYVVARTLGVVREGCPLRDFSDFVSYATNVDADAYLQCAAGILEHDATDAFMAIQEPVLMFGGQHDVLIKVEDCRDFAARHPSTQFEELHCASHAGSIEYGSYVAGRVREFLNKKLPAKATRAA